MRFNFLGSTLQLTLKCKAPIRDQYYRLEMLTKHIPYCQRQALTVLTFLPIYLQLPWRGSAVSCIRQETASQGMWNFQLSSVKAWSRLLNLSASQYPHLENEGEWYLSKRRVIRTNQKTYKVWVFKYCSKKSIYYYDFPANVLMIFNGHRKLDFSMWTIFSWKMA